MHTNRTSDANVFLSSFFRVSTFCFSYCYIGWNSFIIVYLNRYYMKLFENPSRKSSQSKFQNLNVHRIILNFSYLHRIIVSDPCIWNPHVSSFVLLRLESSIWGPHHKAIAITLMTRSCVSPPIYMYKHVDNYKYSGMQIFWSRRCTLDLI